MDLALCLWFEPEGDRPAPHYHLLGRALRSAGATLRRFSDPRAAFEAARRHTRLGGCLAAVIIYAPAASPLSATASRLFVGRSTVRALPHPAPLWRPLRHGRRQALLDALVAAGIAVPHLVVEPAGAAAASCSLQPPGAWRRPGAGRLPLLQGPAAGLTALRARAAGPSGLRAADPVTPPPLSAHVCLVWRFTNEIRMRITHENDFTAHG